MDWIVNTDTISQSILSIVRTGGSLSATQEAMILQRYIMTIYYYATTNNGATDWDYGKDNWLSTSKNVCDWSGNVTCTGNGGVESLIHNGNYNTGISSMTLPSEIFHLSSLKKLRIVGQTNLGGRIPDDVSNLHQLTHLDLSFNALSGTIPTQFGGLTSLDYLWLSKYNTLCVQPNQLFFLPRSCNRCMHRI